MRAAALAVILAALAACTQPGTGVALTVDAGSLAPDELDVTASYDGRSIARVVSVAGTATLTLLAQLPDETTSVSFAVVGKRGGKLVGQGASGPIAVAAHKIASATVTLDGGGGGGDGGTRDGAADLGSRGSDGGDGGGALWTRQHGALPPTGAAVNALWGSSGSDVYAACSLAGNVNLLRSTDHGQHWTAQLAGGAVNLDGAAGTSAGDVILVGDNATILRGSGTSWTAGSAPVPATTRLDAVFALAPGDVYIAGSGNVILHSVTGGWVTQTATGTTELRAVWGVTGHLWAVGSSGTILRSTGNGVWAAEVSGTGAELRAVFGSGAGDVWAAGDGVLLHSDGSGAWSDASASVPHGVSLRALYAAPGGPLFAAGSGWTILRHDAGGWTAEPSGLTVDDPAGDKLNALFVPSSVEAFAGGDGLVILHRP